MNETDAIDLQALDHFNGFTSSGFAPSDQQAAIFECGISRRSHICVIARAGTGKTTISMELILEIVSAFGRNLKIVVVQFNKSIQVEAQDKITRMGLADTAIALTCHSVGNSSLFRHFGKKPVDQFRTQNMLPEGLSRDVKDAVSKLVSACKNLLLSPAELDTETLDDLSVELSVELGENAQEIFEWVPRILTQSKTDVQSWDFDDMLWLPIVLNLDVRQADFLIVDESQDLNPAQHQMVLKMLGRTGRLMFIGDPKQAIYAFRGADHTSMDTMAGFLKDTERGLETFPLTVTRRCPKSVVRLAQQLVPDFEAHPDAIEGEVRLALPNERPERGDLVLCRTNAPLVQMAYELIRLDIPARIQGRDIGKGLENLIGKLAKHYDTVDKLMDRLSEYEDRERGRIARSNRNVERKLQALEDKCECIRAVSEGMRTVKEVLDRISTLFANIEISGNHGAYVLLSTVHKAKGMESDVVRILHPELMPHPMAKGKSRLQEEHIGYVAITRAKKVLIFHGTPRLVVLEADEEGEAQLSPAPGVKRPELAQNGLEGCIHGYYDHTTIASAADAEPGCPQCEDGE